MLDSNAISKSQVRAYKIEAGNELRIIAHSNQPCSIRLYSPALSSTNDGAIMSSAEIFGAELPPDVEMNIAPSSRLAIYTWHGCIIQIKGLVQQEYQGINKSMKDYLEVIQVLDSRREYAKLHNTYGPRVLITGSSNSGKSTLCQILCNYAARRGYVHMYVELDPRGSTDKPNMQFPAGIIGASIVDEFFPHRKELKDSLAFFFGHLNVTDDIQLYLYLCHLLSGAIFLRNQNSSGTNSIISGFIVNAPYQPSTELLEELISIFNIDVVIVMDDPSTQHYLADKYDYKEPVNYEDLEKQLKSKNEESETLNNQDVLTSLPKVSVVGVSKSDGVISITSQRLAEIRRECLKSYFFGSPEYPLRPHTITLKVVPMKDDGTSSILPGSILTSTWCHLVELQITSLPASALPADQDVSMIANTTQVVPFNKPLKSLINAIAGISNSKNSSNVAISSLAGIIHIRAVHEEPLSDDISVQYLSNNNTPLASIEVWCPGLSEQGEFPSHYIILGNIQKLKWHLE
ncbi:uncharacterized protein CMU_038930 [Cryptosporidium muris RN66]|uniref:AAA+ ATPase domain-containing protein n=1 Tax=Cryptosporidium muris (strain RN66) TaxID=441375 RepID=B6A9D5_CRYMR|nr:uncharacterized protein CMU_038930 [Cryptosporidium muris RN66]EEA04826.1 hypothetical protein, conserved [Cryptosporidium muris RN66]|eukprot:XP_002139175.1 hypothetical protein [Cryptosporidium muris RN66]